MKALLWIAALAFAGSAVAAKRDLDIERLSGALDRLQADAALAPVEPTTRIKPRGSITRSLMMAGRRSASIEGISLLIARITMPTSPRCLNVLTRKRPASLTAIAMFISRSRSNAGTWPSSISEYAIFFTMPPGSPVLPSG